MSELPSTVREVVVFGPGGARVTRAAELRWGSEGPPAEVTLAGLPLALSDQGLRARVVALEGPAPTAVALRVELRAVAPVGEDRALEARIDEALAEEHRLDAIVGAVERVWARWDGLAVPPRGHVETHPPVPPPAEARLALLALRTSRRGHLARELEELRRERLAASQRRKALEDERKRRASLDARDLSKAIVVRLARGGAEAAAGAARLELDYRVPGARWAPSYALRLARGADGLEAELELRAAVAQATGEDWTDVALTVVTSGPDEVVDVPPLESLRIGRAQPPPRRGFKAPPEGAEALYADFDAARAERVVPRGEAPARDEPAPRAEPFADLTRAGGFAGGAPPMQAALSPQALAPPKAKSAPAPARGARHARPKAEEVEEAAASLGGADEGRPEAPAPGRFDLGEAWLDFERLELPDPLSAGRGHLAPLHPARLGPPGRLAGVSARALAALEAVVEAAVRRASDLDPAPAGAADPRPLAGVHAAYRGRVPVSVASTGGFQLVPLERHRAPATERCVAVPREAPHAYRVVELQNPTSLPLLAGPVDVTSDGAYLLTASLRATPRRGRVTLGLGVEPRLRVARNATFEEASAGLMGGSLALEHRVEIELQNLGALPARVEVRERVPVTPKKDTDATVEAVRADPPWQPWTPPDQPLEGGHAWTVDVPGKGSRKLSFQYVIKTSAKLELVGGNRREP